MKRARAPGKRPGSDQGFCQNRKVEEPLPRRQRLGGFCLSGKGILEGVVVKLGWETVEACVRGAKVQKKKMRLQKGLALWILARNDKNVRYGKISRLESFLND